MEIQKAFNTHLNNYLFNIDQYDVIGWEQEQFYNCTTKYPFIEKTKLSKNHRRPLPIIKQKSFRDNKRIDVETQTPMITSHLFCPAKHLPTHVTSIKFIGPRDTDPNRLRFPKNSKSVTSKGNRPLSRLLIQLSPEHCSSPKNKNFVLHGQKTRYFKKKGKRQTQCFFRSEDDKDPLFEEMLSMTIPSFKERLGNSRSSHKPVEEWFNGSKELIMSKVGRQIKGRSMSQRLKL